MRVAIIGGGIGGLALALGLHSRGISCDVYEAAAEIRELGVGITLLPHAMKELAALGVQAELEPLGIENLESVFFNRWGQFIYREPRGRHFKHGHAGARRGLTQARQCGQQHGRFAVVGGRDAPRVGSGRRIERRLRCDGLFQRGQRVAQRFAQRLGARRGPHPAWARQQQRIVEDLAQARQVHADGRLRIVQALRRARHIVLGQQHIERHQQVQIEPPQISHGNT